jgi:hypothetical protein
MTIRKGAVVRSAYGLDNATHLFDDQGTGFSPD